MERTKPLKVFHDADRERRKIHQLMTKEEFTNYCTYLRTHNGYEVTRTYTEYRKQHKQQWNAE